jgi:hypothetical protein
VWYRLASTEAARPKEKAVSIVHGSTPGYEATFTQLTQIQFRLHGCQPRRAPDCDTAGCLYARRRTTDPRVAAAEARAKGQDWWPDRCASRAQRACPPTAKGFCFLAVEDPEGMVNVVVPPDVYEQCRQAIHSAFVIVEGVVQKDHGAINVLAAAVREV